MAMWRIQYQVQTRGFDFPIDMLRYDSSFPYSSQDVAVIEDSFRVHTRETRSETKTVTLVHYADNKNWQPTFGRWQSFMWSVVPHMGVSKISG